MPYLGRWPKTSTVCMSRALLPPASRAIARHFETHQVLIQDVRSVHQGRGLASDELYECCFDNVVMFFVTTEDEMRVVSAE